MKYVWFFQSVTSDDNSFTLFSAKANAKKAFESEIENNNVTENILRGKESGSFAVEGVTGEWGRKEIR